MLSVPLRLALCALCAAALLSPSAHAAAGAADGSSPALDDTRQALTYGQREDVNAYGQDLAQRRGLDPAWVQSALNQAHYIPTVARLIMPPPVGTAKNWTAYRNRFIEPVRVRAGAAFWRANEAWLKLAQERYGVPPEIVVGIIGVESIYGQQMGTFRVIDALSTLTFDFPQGRKDKSPFFRAELEDFLVMCNSHGIDPVEQTGSFAGAIGMPQFMPSSINSYAIDFDGDGQIDLREDAADVIGSVAHYLAAFGWRRDLPTHFDVDAPDSAVDRATLLVPDILPSFSISEFVEHGAVLSPFALATDARLDDSGGLGKLALIELQNGSAAPVYFAGTTNFYVVTRYNWSSYYAMAVIELGQAVARELARNTH